MNTIVFIFLVVAAALFGVDAWLKRTIVPLGLCILTIGFIMQLAATHTITF